MRPEVLEQPPERQAVGPLARRGRALGHHLEDHGRYRAERDEVQPVVLEHGLEAARRRPFARSRSSAPESPSPARRPGGAGRGCPARGRSARSCPGQRQRACGLRPATCGQGRVIAPPAGSRTSPAGASRRFQRRRAGNSMSTCAQRVERRPQAVELVARLDQRHVEAAAVVGDEHRRAFSGDRRPRRRAALTCRVTACSSARSSP